MNSKFHFAPLLFLLFLALGVASCKSSGDTEYKETSATQSAGDDSQRILDKETFAAQIKKSGVVVVDLRMPQEFEQNHIEGAININFFGPEFKFNLLELDRKKKYYLYGKNEATAYRSMKFMEDNDFKEVFILKDGYKEWNTVHAQ